MFRRFPRILRAVPLLLALPLASCGDESPPAPTSPPGDVNPAWPIRVAGGSEPALPFERIVLATIDTLRPDHLGCYGYPRPTSPFLDRMAERGVRFTRAFSQISHTAPAHATLLTGLVPSIHGLVANGMRLDERATTLATLFQRAGYSTVAFYNVSFLDGLADSFEVHHAAPNTGERVLARALDWLSSPNRPERFFLWLHLYDPHHWNKPNLWPNEELEELARAAPRTDDEIYREIALLHGFDDPSVAFWDSVESGRVPGHDHASIARMLRAYDAQILKADRLLERFHDALEAQNLPGETLWIVTSDHGEGLGSHGYFGHTARIYNEQLRVPWIVASSNGTIEPRVVDATIEQIDLFPTLAELLGMSVQGLDPVNDGRSFLGLLTGGEAGPEREVWSERCLLEGEERLVSLQSAAWKLLVHGEGPMECFDLTNDPLELDPLPAEEAPELLASFRSREARVDARALQRGTGAQEAPPDEWLEELKDLGYVR
ncbi:MAG TPA: hypothetical protein ENJ09_13745 [Planctomycetes bacterium]|nr:hypothetical protein [Planctomycetota bacterium]